MKITRREIRKLIKEEAKRELPISYYSDDLVIQEGLFDFLSGLFGGLLDFFTGAFQEAEGKTRELWSKAEGEVNRVASSVLGKEEAADIKSFDDLDMEKKEHKKVYFSSLLPISEKSIDEIISLLGTAAEVKDWTPADDSEEAAKKWQDENGEAATGLFKAAGNVGGALKFYGEKGIKSAAAGYSEYQEKVKSGNPAGAVQALVAGSKVLSDVWSFAATLDIKNADSISAGWEKVGNASQELGKMIEASGKEQQKESLELRKLINHMIIAERKIIKENK